MTTIQQMTSYCDQFEAHLDEGGKFKAANVRDLIGFVRDLETRLRIHKEKHRKLMAWRDEDVDRLVAKLET